MKTPNFRPARYETPDAQKVRVETHPTEYRALIGGLSTDAGKDAYGDARILWSIGGIQSIDFCDCIYDLSEHGSRITFNLDSDYDVDLFRKEIEIHLDSLREQREATRVSLARTGVSSVVSLASHKNETIA